MKTEQMAKLYGAGESCSEIAEKAGVTRQSVWERLTRAGYELRPARSRELPPQFFQGEKFTEGGHGYFRSTTSRSGRLMHRVVWEFHHGDIPAGHDVHHIDGNPANNEVSNLQLISKRDHGRLHANKKGTPVRFCAHCGVRLRRKRYPSGRLEPPSAIKKRKFCSTECHGAWSAGRSRTEEA